MKILIEAMHGLGDTVCMLPMIRLVREAFPKAYILVLVKFEAAQWIIQSSGISIDEIRCLDIYKNMGNSIRMLMDLRRMHFDYGISAAVTPVRKANYFMKVVAPQKHIGLQTKGLFFDSMNDSCHFVEAGLQSVSQLCQTIVHDAYPSIIADKKIVDVMKARLRKLTTESVIGVCIGDADPSLKNRFLRTGKVYTRSWGVQHMAELIQLLRKENLSIVLIGGKNEMHLMDYIRSHVSMDEKILDMVGQTSLRESIALVSLCDVVFGVDTGMQHIAAAVGVKTVSVFGPTDPKTHGAYSPLATFLVKKGICDKQYCYGTKYYIHCPCQRRCLQLISSQEACKAILNRLHHQ